jgi:hypothetical protein
VVRRPLLEVSPHEYWLAIPGIARYRVTRGSDIEIHVEPGARALDVTTYLTSYALAALCCQRGLLVLHATAVALDGRALVLIGPSASGKSTLGAALVAGGGVVLCDDLCVIDTSAPTALVYPSTRFITVWADVAEHLGHDTAVLEPPLTGLQKFRLPMPVGPVSGVPLRHVLTLTEALTMRRAIELEPLPPLRALSNLASTGSLAAVIAGMNRQQAHLEQCGRVLRQAPGWQLSRPLDLARLREVAAVVEQLAQRSSAGARNALQTAFTAS